MQCLVIRILIVVISLGFISCTKKPEINVPTPTIKGLFDKLPTAPQQYVQGINDLPLYNGFKRAESGNVVYDTVNGRIVEGYYHSLFAEPVDVVKFYEETLPELGWDKVTNGEYEREGEKLSIMVSEQNRKTILRIYLSPLRLNS